MEIRLTSVTFGDEEIAEVLDSLRSGFVTMGEKCRRFEEAFSVCHDGRPAVFVNSGSSANLLAWFGLFSPSGDGPTGGFPPGAEVIVPAVAWSTTIWPIVQAGGVPVLADCDPGTLTIIPEEIEKGISPDTVAVCLVHPLGNVCDMDAITDICDRHGLVLMEDTCEALGSAYDSRPAGCFGDVATFSFYFSHHITTIEGGMALCRDETLARNLRILRAHGWSREAGSAAEIPFERRYEFINTGFNLRPTEINGALGLHQIAKLDRFKAARAAAVDRLLQLMTPLIEQGFVQPMTVSDKVDASYFGFSVLCRDKGERDRLVGYLEINQIETRPIICGNMARQPAMKRFPHRLVGALEGADHIMDRGLYWGIHPNFSDAHVEYLAKVLSEFKWN
jgi:CDP-6-deoxy-D-xylo-4-hexulose-3-dehydrase